MSRFKVLAGRHVEGVGEDKQVYKRDDEFESDQDLDVLFANKFQRLDGPTKRARDHDDSLDSSGRVMDAAEHNKPKQIRDQAGGGARPTRTSTKDQGVRARGEDPDDEEIPDDPDVQDQNEEEEEEAPAKKKSAAGNTAKEKAKAEPDEEEDEVDGADVTDQFGKAQDGGFSVVKSEKGYTVAKEGKSVGAPVKTKREVLGLVKKHGKTAKKK